MQSNWRRFCLHVALLSLKRAPFNEIRVAFPCESMCLFFILSVILSIREEIITNWLSRLLIPIKECSRVLWSDKLPLEINSNQESNAKTVANSENWTKHLETRCRHRFYWIRIGWRCAEWYFQLEESKIIWFDDDDFVKVIEKTSIQY